MIGSYSPNLMESLVESTVDIGNSFTNEKPSACQVRCKHEQLAVVHCVDTVRESGDTSCMNIVVQAWTKCCADANLSQIEEKV